MMKVVLLGSLIPSLMLIYLIHRLDRFKEPLWSMVFAFILGLASPLVTLQISGYTDLIRLLFLSDNEFTQQAHPWLYSLSMAAIPEELGRLIILWVMCATMKSVEEPFDCLVYGATVWAGFAATENVLYALKEIQEGGSALMILSLRASLCTIGHTAWGVLLGAYVGLARFGEEVNRKLTLFKGLFITISLHMLYDGLLFSVHQGHPLLRISGAFAIDVLSLVLAIVFLMRMRTIQGISSYEGEDRLLQTELFKRHTPDSVVGIYELISQVHLSGLFTVAFAMTSSSICFALSLKALALWELSLDSFWLIFMSAFFAWGLWHKVLKIAQTIDQQTSDQLLVELSEHQEQKYRGLKALRERLTGRFRKLP
jgi:RsiW-degrading membrane proteinase PrsW (M82 family)